MKSWVTYFDKPDDEACFEKMWMSVKACTILGAITSWVDITAITYSKTHYDKMQRVSHWVAPFVAMGVTTSAVSCGVASIRKKDDAWNYLIGGFAGGAIWGAKYRNAFRGVQVGVFWALFCGTAKVAARDRWVLSAENYHLREHGTFRDYQRDFSLRKDPKDLPKKVYEP